MEGFAHSVSGNGQLRLVLCPALRKLLTGVGAVVVAEDKYPGLSHAEVVVQGAAGLRDGENEGIVLVYERNNGQASLRKWKNSAEGASARHREALLLRTCHDVCLGLVSEGKLDSRVAEMIDALRSVAEAHTSPMKKGRNKGSKKAK